MSEDACTRFSCHMGATHFRDLHKRVHRRRVGIYMARNPARDGWRAAGAFFNLE